MHLAEFHRSVEALAECLRRFLPRYLLSRRRNRRVCDRLAFDLCTVLWHYRSCFLLDDFAIDSESLSLLIDDLRIYCSFIPQLKSIRVIRIDGNALLLGHHSAIFKRLSNGPASVSEVVFIDVAPNLEAPKVLLHQEIVPEINDVFTALVAQLNSGSGVIEVTLDGSTLSLSTICASLLEYPVCYVLRKDQGNSFRPNCLGNVLLEVFNVDLQVCGKSLTAFSYSCPADFSHLINSERLKSLGFTISSRTVTSPLIPL